MRRDENEIVLVPFGGRLNGIIKFAQGCKRHSFSFSAIEIYDGDNFIFVSLHLFFILSNIQFGSPNTVVQSHVIRMINSPDICTRPIISKNITKSLT